MAVCALGIDLGTTNSTVSWASTSSLKVLDIPQISTPGSVGEYRQMPSALYIPMPGEHAADALQLPWESESRFVIGRYAKERASTAPDRVLLSAKSWLCNAQVDRKDAILPWGSEIAEEKVSAFEASKAYLQHLQQAALSSQADLNSLADVEIVVTVPASFDEVARNLTAEAAGLENITLLEEPLAAMYSWIARQGDAWREQISVGETILVCDIGGGTADFSLIYVGENNGELTLERLSVGDHILLGGDNMDLALAYQLRGKLEASGKKLDTWQFQSLVHESQKAKERLLGTETDSVPVTLAGKGSSLFASTLQVEALQAEVHQLILDGFFPMVESTDIPAPRELAGIQEFGLPFEQEPALSKHLAAFLQQSCLQIRSMQSLPEEIRAQAEAQSLQPNAVLFNGGVCKSDAIRERILGLLKHWNQGVSVRELTGNDFDIAVAEGAAYYGRTRAQGEGLRIRAGIPRSYYLGIESSAPAIPGFRPPVKGVCVVPHGMEEGSELSLEEQTFSLRTGQEVEFRFFSSTERSSDSVGSVLEDAESELEESTRLRVTLPAGEGENTVPVKLHSKVTDVGTLELWMQDTSSDASWRLEFDVRAEKKTLQTKQSPLIANS